MCHKIFTTNILDFLSHFKIVLLADVFKSMFIFHSIMFNFIKIKTTDLYRFILLSLFFTKVDKITGIRNINIRQIQLINHRLMCLTVCDKYLTDKDELRY